MMDEVLTHDHAVDELNRAYGKRQNARVPVAFASDESLWLSKTGHSFADFYRDPRLHLSVHLAGQKWMGDNVVADQRRAYPDRWRVTPRLWMAANELFCCEQAGRFKVMGFIVPRTPLGNVRAAYEAGLRFGEIEPPG